MTLEDVVNAGKEEKKVRGAIDAFHKAPYTNIVMALKDVKGIEKLYKENGFDAENTSELTPAQMNDFAENTHKIYAGDLITRVQEDYAGVARTVVSEKDGMDKAVGLLSKIKPVKYNGANEEIYSAHEKLVKMRDPKEFAKQLDKYNDSLAGRAVLFLMQKSDKLKKIAYLAHLKAAEKNLREKLANAENAVGYFAGIYESADDKNKRALAYEFGTSLIEPVAKKEEPAEEDELDDEILDAA